MIEINGKKMCKHCFANLSDDNKCQNPKCISHESNENGLPEGYVLNGKYVIGRKLYYDQSFCGYIAYDASTDTRVLLRELFPSGYSRSADQKLVVPPADAESMNIFKNNFCSEINIMAKINNEKAVAKTRDLFEKNETIYSVADFAPNAVLLSEHIYNCGGKISEQEALSILTGAIEALDIIHKSDCVHGNIRPENIIINNGNICFTGFNVGDFKSRRDITSVGGALENCFAPIECLKSGGNIGEHSDIYALGSTLLYAVTGKAPEHSYTRITSDTSTDTSGISDAFAAIITKMIAVKASDRYADLHELCADLNKKKLANIKVKPSKKPTAEAATIVSVADPTKKKSKAILIAIIIILLLAGAAAAVVFGILLPKYNEDKEKADENLPVVTDEEKQDIIGESEDGKTDGEDDKSEDEDDKSDEENGKSDEKADDPDKGDIIGDFDPSNFDPSDFVPSNPSNNDDKLEIPTKNSWILNTMENYSDHSGVFGNKDYKKDMIVSIEVFDSLDNISEDAWDISKNQNGSVMAWVESAGKNKYSLYLAGNGGINLQNTAEGLFCEYENAKTIKLNGALHSEYTVSTKNMFKNCKSLTELDVSSLNTKSTENMSNMFENCKTLTTIILSENFDTSKVVTMKSMFDGCFALKTIDLSGFDTKKVADLSYMFYKCYALTKLDLSGFVTPKLETVEKMFYECKNLKKLDMSNLNCRGGIITDDMFVKCSELSDFVTDSQDINTAYELSR